MALMPEAASTMDVERQLLPSPPHYLLSHFSEFPSSGETALAQIISLLFLSKQEVFKLLAFSLALQQAWAGADTSGLSGSDFAGICVLSETPSLTESVPSFGSDALTPASAIQMAASAWTIPENASSRFNGIKTRTGVFSCLSQIPHLVYLKIMSKSTGISNTSHLSSARYTKHDATKARHAVPQPFSLVCITN